MRARIRVELVVDCGCEWDLPQITDVNGYRAAIERYRVKVQKWLKKELHELAGVPVYSARVTHATPTWVQRPKAPRSGSLDFFLMRRMKRVFKGTEVREYLDEQFPPKPVD